MKVYVVTSLIESEDDGAEVNIIGIRKTEKEARVLMEEALKNVREMYVENDIDYYVNSYNDNTTFVIEQQNDGYDEDEDYYSESTERITLNITESEVK